MKKWIPIIASVSMVIVGISSIGDGNIGAGIFAIVIGLGIGAIWYFKFKKAQGNQSVGMKKNGLPKVSSADEELRKQGIYPKFENSSFDFDNIVVVDTETTGKSADKDEILQLSIINGNGDVLFNRLIRPVHRRKWEDATSVNGITPEAVKNEKHIDYYADEVSKLLEGKTIVGYNIDFDMGFLKKAEVVPSTIVDVVDVMKPFAWINAEYDERFDEYKWKKLSTCARHYGYKWEGNAHDSLADCKATLYCFKKMCGM